MPSITLYVSKENELVWKEAAKLLKFHDDTGLTAYLTPTVKRYVEKHKATSINEK